MPLLCADGVVLLQSRARRFARWGMLILEALTGSILSFLVKFSGQGRPRVSAALSINVI
jgi:hypothetical protein